MATTVELESYDHIAVIFILCIMIYYLFYNILCYCFMVLIPI